jgi:ABC-type uncharacterized transport system permease subunit
MGACVQTRTVSIQWAAGWLADWWADAVLYRRLIGARLRAQMQYRASFLLMTLVSFVVTGSDLLAILILFNYFGELAGWRAGEVALLYGLAMVGFGLSARSGSSSRSWRLISNCVASAASPRVAWRWR